MNFGEALAALKRGERVAREGWNGKGMWLVLVVPHGSVDADKVQASALVRLTTGRIPLRNLDGDLTEVRLSDWLGRPGSSGASPRLLPFIGMKTANNEFVPWLASQTDLLAEDWVAIT